MRPAKVASRSRYDLTGSRQSHCNLRGGTVCSRRPAQGRRGAAILGATSTGSRRHHGIATVSTTPRRSPRDRDSLHNTAEVTIRSQQSLRHCGGHCGIATISATPQKSSRPHGSTSLQNYCSAPRCRC